MRHTINIIAAILAAAFLTGCRSTRPAIPSAPVLVNTTDSVATVYIETVRIDTVTVEVPLPMESAKQTTSEPTSHLETSVAESDAWINPDGTLGHSLTNKPATLQGSALVPAKDTHTAATAATVKEIPVPYPEPVYVERALTRWQQIRLDAFPYLTALSALLLLWTLRKSIKNILKSH